VTRQFLRKICRALIGVVLFAQLAVSAYACPRSSSAAGMKMQMAAAAAPDAGATDAAVSTADRQAPNCEDMAGSMDPEFANLCAEHCHQGQQSDHSATLTVPAALLNALYVIALAPEPAVAPRPAADATSALVAASPPHTILHCCFRI
jgi:hypothetical protein